MKDATAWEVSAMGRNLGRFAVASALSLALAAPIQTRKNRAVF